MEAINKVFTLSKETDSVLSTKIYIKGTSGRTDGTSNYNSVQINGYEWLRAYENLISFAVLSKSGERLYINYTINTSSQGTTTLVDLINAYAEDGNIIILVSSGKISVDTNLQNALQKFGGSDTLTVSSGYCAYYFLGQYGMGSGQAYTGHELGEGKSVYVTASLANGVLQPCGQNGKDSVKYSIDYSTKEAYVDNTNTVTCNIDGQVVKWVGGNKYLVNGAVVKIYPTSNTGYFQEITTTTNTNVGDGYFECIQFNGDNFNKDTTIASSISFTIEVRYAGVLVFTDSLNFTRQGETGKSLYTWIKYSTIYPATKASMTDAKTDTTRYIGIAYNKPSNVESDEPSDYTWTAIKGEDGTSFTAKGKADEHFTSYINAGASVSVGTDVIYLFDKGDNDTAVTSAGILTVKSNSQSISYPSDGDAYTTSDYHIWIKDGNMWVDLGMIKGDKGDDAVTYEVVFSRRDAYVNSLGKITAGFAGILYKIVGANRTIFTGATFKIGYSDGKGGEGTSYETVSAGIDNVFTNSDNFFDTKDYSSTACNNSKSIYVDVIVNNVTVKTYHETFSFAGDKGDVGGQLEIRRHETGFAADYQYYSGTTKVGSLFFLDYVYIVNPDAESGYDVYRCIQDVIYSSIPTDFTTADFKAHWKEISTYDDAYFNYIIAKSASINFLKSNNITPDILITSHQDGEPYITIQKGLFKAFGRVAMNLKIGVDDDGMVVMNYYDNAGRILWSMGKSGPATASDILSATWEERVLVNINKFYSDTSKVPNYCNYNDADDVLTTDDSRILFWMKTNKETEIIYIYHAAKSQGNIIADPDNGFNTSSSAAAADGKAFTQHGGALVSGTYTYNNNLTGYEELDEEHVVFMKPFYEISNGVITGRYWNCSKANYDIVKNEYSGT